MHIYCKMIDSRAIENFNQRSCRGKVFVHAQRDAELQHQEKPPEITLRCLVFVNLYFKNAFQT